MELLFAVLITSKKNPGIERLYTGFPKASHSYFSSVIKHKWAVYNGLPKKLNFSSLPFVSSLFSEWEILPSDLLRDFAWIGVTPSIAAA